MVTAPQSVRERALQVAATESRVAPAERVPEQARVVPGATHFMLGTAK
jgi:hypothetical protein